ncbi:MAG: Type 1 glutamine amidotransferase-like domain-containing protein [Microbacterium sp.]
MRMLLTASGLRNPTIINALAEMLERPFAECRVAIVLTASLVTEGDKSWVADSIARISALGWQQLDLIELNAGPVELIERRLSGADVVYVAGGNQYFLADSIRARGLTTLFEDLASQKVYVGESAGAMIFCRPLAAGVATMGDEEELTSLGIENAEPVLPLLDWYLKPHLDSVSFPERTERWARERAAALGKPIWFIDDDTALAVTDPSQDPIVVSEGSWLRL